MSKTIPAFSAMKRLPHGTTTTNAKVHEVLMSGLASQSPRKTASDIMEVIRPRIQTDAWGTKSYQDSDWAKVPMSPRCMSCMLNMHDAIMRNDETSFWYWLLDSIEIYEVRATYVPEVAYHIFASFYELGCRIWSEEGDREGEADRNNEKLASSEQASEIAEASV